MSNVDEMSIEKYLQAITTINSTLGRLDVLKLHIKSTYDDKVADIILESIIKELSAVCGVNYKTIDLKIDKTIQPISNTTKQIILEKNKNIGYVAPASQPMTIEIIEDNNHVYEEEKQKQNDINIAKATLQAETQKKQKKAISDVAPVGVQYDSNTCKYTYSFVNSNTLAYMIYEKLTKQLIVTFKQMVEHIYIKMYQII